MDDTLTSQTFADSLAAITATNKCLVHGAIHSMTALTAAHCSAECRSLLQCRYAGHPMPMFSGDLKRPDRVSINV